MSLRLDWCGYDAAKYAVEHWHYSRTMPAGKLVKIGVWENDQFIGVVIFGRSANNHIGSPWGLEQTEVCELVRVALRGGHKAAVSRVVSIALRMLRLANPGLRLVVSYADPEQGHVGSIYQAGNWAYVGTSRPQSEVIVNGKFMHKRSAFQRFGTVKGLQPSEVFWKHKYLMPLDSEMLQRIDPLRQAYPKRTPFSGADPQGQQAVRARPVRSKELNERVEIDDPQSDCGLS